MYAVICKTKSIQQEKYLDVVGRRLNSIDPNTVVIEYSEGVLAVPKELVREPRFSLEKWLEQDISSERKARSLHSGWPQRADGKPISMLKIAVLKEWLV